MTVENTERLHLFRKKRENFIYTVCMYLAILCIVGFARLQNSCTVHLPQVFHTLSDIAVRLFIPLEISSSKVHSHRQRVAACDSVVNPTLHIKTK